MQLQNMVILLVALRCFDIKIDTLYSFYDVYAVCSQELILQSVQSAVIRQPVLASSSVMQSMCAHPFLYEFLCSTIDLLSDFIQEYRIGL